jgi:hypothetical protein
MKSIITSALKNYAIFMGVILIVPLAYAATQASPNVSTSSDGTYGTSSSLLAPTTILTAEMPELSPEGTTILTYGTDEKAKKGTIEDIDRVTSTFTLQVGETSILVKNTATTTFYTGTGSEITFNDMEGGATVYVFGFMRSDDQAMSAIKVVVANKSKLERIR